ncbi:hypothetical protein L345_07987, partial [Ophiophagus hannah]
EVFLKLWTLFSATSERNAVIFNFANALHLKERFIMKEQYLHSNQELFQAAVKLVNFQHAKASAKAISPDVGIPQVQIILEVVSILPDIKNLYSPYLFTAFFVKLLMKKQFLSCNLPHFKG